MKTYSQQLAEIPPDGFLPIPEEDFNRTVVEYFESIVEKYSDKAAIIDKYSEINYRDLNSVSNQCARSIINILGDVTDKPVLFLANLDISSIIASLGILKSGNIYVALDTTNPIERLNAIVEDSQAHLIITSVKSIEIARTIAKSELQVLNLDSLDENISKENLPLRANSKNLAVIFYTSGSTGKPKGVLLDHRALMERVATKINTEFIMSEDRLLLPFPVGFGWSTQPVFGALLSGARLYIQSYSEISLTELQIWLETNQITYLPVSSSFFRQLLASLPPDGRQMFPNIRTVHTAAESLHPQDVLSWQDHFSNSCKLIYSLSSTEGGGITRVIYDTNSEVNKEILTVGNFSDPMKLYILDEDNKPVDKNIIGQLSYNSPAMLQGYWNRPDINSQKFIPDPEDVNQKIFLSGDMGRITMDGSLEFFGRKDNQIKIRGFRIDTTEVETGLLNHPSVKEVFVTSWMDKNKNTEPQLVAYVSLKDNSGINTSDIRNFMTANLPDYMVPTRYLMVKELPLNPNGKVDRKALPVPGSKRPEINTTFAAPSTELESKICEIWQDVLNIDQVGVNDDFFELGGNSLIALQMIIRTEKLVGQKTSPLFFQHPTITNLIADLNNQASHVPNQSGEALSQKRNRPFNSNRKRKKKSGRFRQSLRKLESALVVLPYLPILRQSYSAGIQWLLTFSRKSWVKRGLYYYQYSLMRNFIADLDTKQLTVDQIMPASIVGNILINLFARTVDDDESVQASKRMQNSPYPFWNDLIRILLEAPLEILNKYFSVTGLEYLKQAIEANNGVILVNYHSTAGRFASQALLRQLDDVEIVTINQRVARQQSKKWMSYESRKNTDAFDSALFANEALKGQHLLMEGKIIQLVGDIEYENSTNSLRLGGRKYSLKTGFAELALNTGAPVIPLFSTIKADGHVLTTFKPPLDPGSGDRASQIQNLMNGYAAYMDSAWSEAPESVKWTRLRSHLKKPLFD